MNNGRVDDVCGRLWIRSKPSEPGKYLTRWPDGSHVNEVVVRRRGRGFQVYCKAFNDTVAMSDIGDDELEWSKL